jgi:hypothetical protein
MDLEAWCFLGANGSDCLKKILIELVENLLSVQCHSIEEFKNGIIMQAAPRFDSPEMTNSDELLIALEEHLSFEARQVTVKKWEKP